MSRIIVISNRVAVPDASGKPAAGGLAVAVNAALRAHEGLWFGWSGKTSADAADQDPEIFENGGITYAVTDLSQDDLDEYYYGYANRVLWPILHYRVDLAEFSRAEYRGYMRVNAHFADMLERLIKPGDVIWVHDYHLMPFARMLRARGIENKIGFFLHIPCPPPDILTALPRHREILGALMDFDLVGFQTERDAENFQRYLVQELNAELLPGGMVRRLQQITRVGAYPVGIETQTYQQIAEQAENSAFLRAFRTRLTGRSIIIGVDRLDYSKGIPQRLEAFETFLRTYPERRGYAALLQITPKSRSDIPEYIDIEQEVSSLAGSINGAFGEVDWMPVRYVNRSHKRDELAGLYRAAKAGLVTPLRDGMNLVAKEYVAAQDPRDPGVLILSQFAGAAAELNAALIINPYDREGVAAAIHQALEMPLEERADRYRAMIHILKQNDISLWAERFLADVAAPKTGIAA